MAINLQEKYLSMHNVVGFLTTKPTGVQPEEVCKQVYDVGYEFAKNLLGQVYSDGPIYFKTILFSDNDELNDMLIFTTIGNEVDSKISELKSLVFEQNVLLNSPDFSTLVPTELQEYYDEIYSKYRGVANYLAVYHVLYTVEDKIFVDVYSEVD